MGEFSSIRFVKWAGGKGQLIEQFSPLFPKKIERYIEPFVGGGAILFYVIQKYAPKEVIIIDINEELIMTYNAVKNNVDELILKLKEHAKNHKHSPEEYYYKVRAQKPKDLKDIENAARFIYLNKTCFNGLYRVNSKGEFNVPFGKHINPDIIQEEKLKEISKLLKNVKIICASFENVLKYAKKGDVIYLDPPYHTDGKNFTTYTKDNFLEKEQVKLAEVFTELDKKGCVCIESNSDTTFIKKTYSKYDITPVRAKRLINCRAAGRGLINEIVIRNYSS
jgi:DNA adenine methylase